MKALSTYQEGSGLHLLGTMVDTYLRGMQQSSRNMSESTAIAEEFARMQLRIRTQLQRTSSGHGDFMRGQQTLWVSDDLFIKSMLD